MRPPTTASGFRRGLDASVVAAVLLPVLSVLVLLAVDPAGTEEPSARAPRESPLSRATLVCPGLDGSVAVATAGGRRGAVTVTVRDRERRLPVRPGRLTTTDLAASGRPVTVTGLDAVAPGLVAARVPATGPPSAPSCTAPEPDRWFTGLGAGPRHASVVELVNPDRGTAVADVVLHGPRGELTGLAPDRLRGISVPGRSTVRLDLADLVPGRGDLTAHVTTSRGRVASAVRDRVGLPGVTPTATGWLPAQADPADSALLLGLAPGDGQRRLAVTNTSADQTRASVRVVTEDAVLSPQGAEEVVVPPLSTVTVDLGEVLTPRLLRDAVGLEVAAGRPVTATVRSVVGADLSLASAGEPVGGTGTVAVLPPGTQQLVVAGAGAVGSVTAVARDAGGDELATRRADLAPDRGRTIDLPRGTRLLEVSLRGTDAVASVLVTRDGSDAGSTVVPLRELVRDALVPDVQAAPR